MKIINEIGLEEFEAWSGAVQTKNTIIEANATEAFEDLVEQLYPDGIEDVTLNDLLWFQSDWIYEMLEIQEDDNE